jgi:hypothetical protein
MTWLGNTPDAVGTYGGATTIVAEQNLTFTTSANQLNLLNGARVNQATLYTLIGADSPGYTTQTQYVQHDGYVGIPHYDTADSPLAAIGGSAQNSANLVNIGGGHSSLNAATSIRFYTAADTTTTTGTLTATLTPSTLQLINAGVFDQYGLYMRLGADVSDYTARTDSTRKDGGITIPHYTNAEEDVLLIRGFSGPNFNTMSIGGGFGGINTFERIWFYAAANGTTETGTGIVLIDINGLSMQNNTVITSPTYYVDDGSSNPNSIYITSDSAGNLVFADTVISAGEVTLTDLLTGGSDYWNRSGTTLSPATDGDVVDIVGRSIKFGADLPLFATRTDSTAKNGIIRIPHYLSAEEDVAPFGMSNNDQGNWLYLGGGGAVFNAATEVFFFVADSTTTLQGTHRASFTPDGLVMVEGHAIYLNDDSTQGVYITTDSAGNMVFADDTISAAEVTLSDLLTGGSGSSYWNRSGTTLSPSTSGDDVQLTGGGVLDVIGQSMTVGGDFGDYTARTDSTAKVGILKGVHYDTDEEDVVYTRIHSGPTFSILGLGGGDTGFNACTSIGFYAAADTTTLTGTIRAQIDVNGLTMRNNSPITSSIYYIDDDDTSNTTTIYISSDSAGNMILADDVISAGEVTLSDLIGGGGGGLTPGANQYEIPYTNSATNDFDYDTNFTYTASALTIGTSRYLSMDEIDLRASTTRLIWAEGVNNNVSIGSGAGGSAYTTANNNVLIGSNAGADIISSTNAIAIGSNALGDLTTLSYIVAIGTYAYGAVTNSQATASVAIGYYAARYVTAGYRNTFIGGYAAEGTSGTPNTGGDNVFIGNQAGRYYTTTSYSVGIGRGALQDATINNAIAIGPYAGENFSSASGAASSTGCIAIGYYAMRSDEGFSYSIGLGYRSQEYASGSYNICIGANTGYQNTVSNNLMIGHSAGQYSQNVAGSVLLGSYAGQYTDGDFNIFIGYLAGQANNTSTYGIGDGNVGIGRSALSEIADGDYNISIGYQTGNTISDGSHNTLIGYDVDVDSGTDDYVFRLGRGANYLLEGSTALSTEWLSAPKGMRNMMNIVSAEVLYTNTAVTSIITLPTNSVIWDIQVEVTTAFTGTGTDLLDIGTSTTINRYVDDLDVSSTGWKTISLSNVPDTASGSSIIVRFQYNDQNSDAGAGVANIYVHYSLHS